MKRPSHKELYGKIRKAKRAVSKGSVLILNQEVVAQDAYDLGYVIEQELVDVLLELLKETNPDLYAGTEAPQKSYEMEIKGLDLFAFVVESGRFKCRVYYKFAFAEGVFWLVSLHQERDN